MRTQAHAWSWRSTHRLLRPQASVTLILLRGIACFTPASTRCTLHTRAFPPSLAAMPPAQAAAGGLRGGGGEAAAKRIKSRKPPGGGEAPQSSKRPRRAAAGAAAAAHGKGTAEVQGSGAASGTGSQGRGEALAKNVGIALAAEGNPKRAADMTRYMKGHFPHFGIDAARRRAIVKGIIDLVGGPKSLTVVEVR